VNHYETLGVPPDATPEEIKAGYRMAASKAHPDKPGGSDVAMQQVNRAYDTLRDPESRQQYDETGSDSSGPSLQQKAMQVFTVMLDELVENEAPVNIVKSIKAKIEEVRRQLDKRQEQANKKRERLQKRRAKVRTKGGAANLVHHIIDAKIEALDAQLQTITESRAINQALVGMIEAYEDDEEEDIGWHPKFDLGGPNPFEPSGGVRRR
jgi:curved DNA-binding protein CbpA